MSSLRPVVRLLIPAAVLIGLAWILTRHQELAADAFGVMASHMTLIPPMLVLAIGFMVFKSLSLQMAAFSAGVPLSLLGCFRIFTAGAAIESVTWPGKLWADSHRVLSMGAAPMKSRVRAVVTWRGVSAVGTVCVATLAGLISMANRGLTPTGGGALLFAAAMGVLLWKRCRRDEWLAMVGRCSGPAIAASLCDVGAMTLAVHSVTGVPAHEFAPKFVMLSMCAGLTMLPMGVGVLDVGCWLILTDGYGISPAVAGAAILCYRALGPGVTLTSGVVSLLWTGLERLSDPHNPPTPDVSSRLGGR